MEIFELFLIRRSFNGGSSFILVVIQKDAISKRKGSHHVVRMPGAAHYLLLEIGLRGIERSELLVAVVFACLSSNFASLGVKVGLNRHVRGHVKVYDVAALAVAARHYVVAAGGDVHEELVVDALFLI